VHPPGDLLQAAGTLARSWFETSAPVSVALTRQMMWQMLASAHPMDAHQVESRAMTSRGGSADAKEGVTAYTEKRAPRFPGRVSHDMPEFFPWTPPRPFE
jgi:enoyl-CoA hydratase/carnithine racemase